jgi:V8-like Glu-specific endopeptidase
MDPAVWVRRSGLCALLACAWGACGEERTEVEARRQPILGGATDVGDPAVVEFVALVSPDEAAICTAFVAASRVLITAGHCIVETAGAPNGVFPG